MVGYPAAVHLSWILSHVPPVLLAAPYARVEIERTDRWAGFATSSYVEIAPAAAVE